MDLQAFYFQAAEAAAATVEFQGDDVAAPKLLNFDVQQQQGVGLGAGDAGARGKSLAAAAVGMAGNDARAREGVSLARDLICPECGKAFQSDKAMHGHLRAHPGRGYKGASRPGTPVAAAASVAAGEARPRKAQPRKEAPELLPIKWPVTAKRSRTPTMTAPPVRPDPAAVLLLEPVPLQMEPSRGVEPVPLQMVPPRSVEPVPLQMVPPRSVEPVPLQMVPPHAVEPAVLLLEPARSDEEEAATTLMELYQSMLGGAPPPPEQDQLHMQDMHVAGHQMPRTDHLELPADQVARIAPASQHAPVEHIFGIILEPQAPEVEQPDLTAASKGKKPMEPESVKSGALVLFPDKLVSPGPSKRPKKRPLQDTDRSLPPAVADAAEEAMPPPLRRIPLPASDRRFTCPIPRCYKWFPTHQALGGHMASHNRANRSTATQHMEGIAATHAVHNIMVHQLRQDAGICQDVLPPVPKAPKAHSCPRCKLVFPTGQALGGHMRKHWLEEKTRTVPATSLTVPILGAVAPAAAPVAPANALAVVLANAQAEPDGEHRDFDLNEMPME